MSNIISNELEYKGYIGEYGLDDKKEFYGRVNGLKRSVITFEGLTVEELTKDFQEGIDDYIDCCKAVGQEPEQPSKG